MDTASRAAALFEEVDRAAGTARQSSVPSKKGGD
jgi:hypothetical protein